MILTVSLQTALQLQTSGVWQRSVCKQLGHWEILLQAFSPADDIICYVKIFELNE